MHIISGIFLPPFDRQFPLAELLAETTVTPGLRPSQSGLHPQFTQRLGAHHQ
jgi:hypothetical protein